MQGMQGHNLIAIYDTRTLAEQVRDRLISEGIPTDDIRLSAVSDRSDAARSDYGTERSGGFWSWLFGDIPDSDRDVYGRHLQENREIVSVWVTTDIERNKAVKIMDEYDPIEIDEPQGELSSSTANLGAAERQTRSPASQIGRTGTPVGGRHEEQVIPVAKEQLNVGKTAEEQRYRVRTHVVERPVRETVNLRDEHVEVERRPASRDAGAADKPQERVVEVTERHEHPVVSKTGRVEEEVVVRKDVTEHPETVTGTVQETKVDVEQPSGLKEERSTRKPEGPMPKGM